MERRGKEVLGSINLVGMRRSELHLLMQGLDQPAYRVGQLMEWLYIRGATELDRMTDLPRALREDMTSAGYRIGLPEPVACTEAADGTVKYLFRVAGGAMVESVYIPEGPRRTVCLSTQVGCGMGCAFCATGRGGLVRNLDAGEIVGQVLQAGRLTGKRITNVVAMGQGEPLANYAATVAAFHLLGAEGMGIAARHLTISTCGLPDGIIRLAGEGQQWQLTVSLHAADDALRDRIMPINRRHPLSELQKACALYGKLTERRITLAYVLIAGFNDTRRAAEEMAAFCRGLSAHVNLIPWNSVPGVSLSAPAPAQVARFRRWLLEAGINATIRRTRGAEFNAACGQLRSKQLEVTP